MTRAETGVVPQRGFVAVIGDLVDSRSLPDRGAVQRTLEETLALLNRRFSTVLASRFVVTLGDEFQGLLEIEAKIDEIWWAYVGSMRKYADTRISFGVGGLSTELKLDSLGMDGPCFHVARESLERGRKENRRLLVQTSFEPRLNPLLDSTTLLLDRLMRGWTEIQFSTLELLQKRGTQEAVARERGVVKQTVNQSLESSLGLEWLQAFGSVCRAARNSGVEISDTSKGLDEKAR